MNVLLTSAGRRTYLVEFFNEALRRRPGGGKTVAGDMSSGAPALTAADATVLLPAISSSGYIDAIGEVLVDQEIDLVIPLNDLELEVLSANRKRLEDGSKATVVVSSPDVVELCADKVLTGPRLIQLGLKTPATFTTLDGALEAVAKGEIRYPVVVKPRRGSASIGIQTCFTERELTLTHELAFSAWQRSILFNPSTKTGEDAIIIQEMIGGREHSLDLINDLNGNPVSVVVKEKLQMRSGETDRAVVVDNPALNEAGKTIAASLGHIGNLDCDVFVEDGQIVVLELNPRFGGGYPFSHFAGVDLPSALLSWKSGQEPTPGILEAKIGTASAKTDRLVEISYAVS